MSGSRWTNEHRRDPYVRRAKKEGYRARSAYKLKQIQNRFKVVRKGDCAVDLGAAPGGWSQVLVELVGPDGAVFGVDLQRIAAVDGATFLQGDFTKKDTHDRLRDALAAEGRSEVDMVASDLAPDMSGNYDLDQARSIHLCGMALRFAEAHLRDSGNFCCKVFEGADFQEFRETLRSKFRRVVQYHPPASRKQSSEVYLVGLGYLRDFAEGDGVDEGSRGGGGSSADGTATAASLGPGPSKDEEE